MFYFALAYKNLKKKTFSLSFLSLIIAFSALTTYEFNVDTPVFTVITHNSISFGLFLYKLQDSNQLPLF